MNMFLTFKQKKKKYLRILRNITAFKNNIPIIKEKWSFILSI